MDADPVRMQYLQDRVVLRCDCGATVDILDREDVEAAAAALGWRTRWPVRCPKCVAEWSALKRPIPCPHNGADCLETDTRPGGPTCDRRFCWAEQRAEWRPRQRAEHRRPPMPPGFDAKRDKGCCRWCGRQIWANRSRGEINKRRSWHEACLDEYLLLTRPDVQRDAVWRRDHGRCYICGEIAPTRLIRGHHTVAIDGAGKRAERREYTEIRWEIDWQVEHVVPLWKVADMPPAQRIKYFMLENLATACTRPCHERKTAEEAAERAKVERLAVSSGVKERKLSKAEKRQRAKQRWESMP